MYDVAVVGSGAAGMMSAITAAGDGKKVLLLEKMSAVGLKLKATGGGKCNITNTLDREEFIDSFGKQGRFMRDALSMFDSRDLVNFLEDIGLKTHAPDGFRVFPFTHDSKSVLDVLGNKMRKVGVEVRCTQNVQHIYKKENLFFIKTNDNTFKAKNVIVATGGLGYSVLGSSGDGYRFAKSFGHSISELHPAMLPLHVEEKWVQNCRADTIAKATLKINLPKMKKYQKTGDLIFTKNGIRGPVVLDFATYVTPLLKTYTKVPLLVNMTKGMNEEDIRNFLSIQNHEKSNQSILELLGKLLPKSASQELCELAHIETDSRYAQIKAVKRDELIKLLAWTPLSVISHDGFQKAMITKGGVKLKEIDPKTMQSKFVKGLYFCGEVVDLDGPCGGYNLQWSFSSGYLAGSL
ncbi:MAG: NAD(P)/FAD-dependent oxidoreductase [Sulfurospirillum sp.]